MTYKLKENVTEENEYLTEEEYNEYMDELDDDDND